MFGSDAADIVYGDGTGGSGRNDSSSALESLAFAQQSTSKKKAEPKTPTVKRPEGMARELWDLLNKDKSLDTELAPLVPGYKTSKAKFGMRKARKWVWTLFDNEARKDALMLGHWRHTEPTEPETVYPFARFNRVMQMPEYTDTQYEQLLASNNDWSRQQTDHLWQLCKTFDLRWPVIHDRWDKEKHSAKSIEDLKERYYAVCGKLAKEESKQQEQQQEGQPVAPAPAQPYRFDADHERRRKEQLIKLWNRTSDQIKEEEQLKQQLKRIEARKRERDRKAQDLQKLITASDLVPASPASVSLTAAAALLKSAQKKQSALTPGAAAARSSGTSTPLTQQSTDAFVGIRFPESKGSGPRLRSQEMKLPSIGQKKLKALEQALEKLQLEQVQPATEAIARTFNELRSDIGLLFDLKTALSACEYELESLRQQYLAANAPAFDIPARIRVSGPAAQDSLQTSSRIICEAMDTQQQQAGNMQRKRKSLTVEQPLMKRFTRRIQ